MQERGEPLRIRRATVQDAPAVLKVFDEVMAWFVEMGNEGQWGSEPWSALPRRVQLVEEACALPEAWVAEDADGRLLAALVLGEAQPYVPAATEPEIYVRVLVASRDARARGIGRRLLAFADDRARAAGVQRLRVDCYGGGSGALVQFYESCGYARISTFDVDGWPGQLLGRSLLHSRVALQAIRESRPDDGARVVEIWRRAVDATHGFLTPEDRLAIDALVCGFLPQAPLWLAVDAQDDPLAFMLLDKGHMEALFVDPACRGTGIGAALVRHGLALHPQMCTDVNEQNAQAVGFYEKMGFERTGRSPVDGQGRPYPLIHLKHSGV